MHPPPRTRPPTAALAAAGVLAVLAAPAGANPCDWFLIPVPGYGPGEGTVLNFVYDASRDYLFISRPQGTIDRYDLGARVMLPRWSVGTFPHGLDITPDGEHLIVAEEFRQPGFAGRILRVDADTGGVTPIPVGPTGNWDVVVTADNRAFVTPTQAVAGGEQRLREVNLATNAWIDRVDVPFSNGRVRPQSVLFRSPDRSRLFLQENGTVPWDTATWSSGTNGFSLLGQQYAHAAFNADGTLMAALWSDPLFNRTVRVLDAQGAIIAEFPGEHALAIAFDPVRARLYLMHRSTNELVTIDTNSWHVAGRRVMPIDFDGSYRMAITADGSLLLVQTDKGIGAIEVGQEPCRCAPDLTTSGAVVPGIPGFGVPDGAVNSDDFFYYLTVFTFNHGCATGSCPSPPDLTTTGAVLQGHPGFGVPDGTLNNEDFFYYLTVFAAGC